MPGRRVSQSRIWLLMTTVLGRDAVALMSQYVYPQTGGRFAL